MDSVESCKINVTLIHYVITASIEGNTSSILTS